MNIRDIKELIQQIEAEVNKRDYEAAHGTEDILMGDFVKFIAENYIGEIAKMAKLIVTVKDKTHPRW